MGREEPEIYRREYTRITATIQQRCNDRRIGSKLSILTISTNAELTGSKLHSKEKR